MVAPLFRGLGKVASSALDFQLPPFLRSSRIGARPSSVVEPFPEMPGIRRAQINPDPQDVNFLNPARRAPDSPFPITPRETPFFEPPLRQRNAESFDPREIIVPTSVKQADGTVRVVPETIMYRTLNPQEVADVSRFVSEDPVAAVFQTIDLFENTKNVEDFVRVLQISNLVRRGTGNERKVIGTMLDTVMTRRARALNVSEDVIDPILYTNSKDMPDVIAARVNPTRAQIEAKYTDSDRFRTDTAKVIRNTRKIEELETIDTLNNGGLVGRALAKGEITSADAAYLLNQANYRRVFLLKKSGVLGDSVKNTVRAQGGTRGIDIIPNMSEFSEARKMQIYKTAIHTSETPEEALQIYAMARSDIRSVTFLDELDEIATIRTTRIIDLEGVDATRLTPRVSPTIDEDAIASANRAQTEFDAARFEAGRPENQGPIIREQIRNPETEKIEEVATGTISKRTLDYSQTPGGFEGNPGRNPLPMWMSDGYVDPSGIVYRMRPEYRGKTTMDLIFDGKRTATTRDKAWKVKPGNIIDFVGDDGLVARVEVTTRPYQLPAPTSREQLNRLSDRWSELEGWEPGLYESMIGKFQFQYKLLSKSK